MRREKSATPRGAWYPIYSVSTSDFHSSAHLIPRFIRILRYNEYLGLLANEEGVISAPEGSLITHPSLFIWFSFIRSFHSALHIQTYIQFIQFRPTGQWGGSDQRPRGEHDNRGRESRGRRWNCARPARNGNLAFGHSLGYYDLLCLKMCFDFWKYAYIFPDHEAKNAEPDTKRRGKYIFLIKWDELYKIATLY